MNLAYWLRRPAMILPRLRYRRWERQNPDKPWLTPVAVDFLEAILTPAMRGFEFGSGRSTAWYAKHLGHLTSIENHQGWHTKVTADLAARGVTNVDYRFIPLDHAIELGEQENYDPLPAYVAAVREVPDASLDLVVVDGHYRSTCIAAAVPKIRPGRWLLVDDLNLWPDLSPRNLPAEWKTVHRSTNGIKFTGIFERPA